MAFRSCPVLFVVFKFLRRGQGFFEHSPFWPIGYAFAFDVVLTLTPKLYFCLSVVQHSYKLIMIEVPSLSPFCHVPSSTLLYLSEPKLYYSTLSPVVKMVFFGF